MSLLSELLSPLAKQFLARLAFGPLGEIFSVQKTLNVWATNAVCDDDGSSGDGDSSGDEANSDINEDDAPIATVAKAWSSMVCRRSP